MQSACGQNRHEPDRIGSNTNRCEACQRERMTTKTNPVSGLVVEMCGVGGPLPKSDFVVAKASKRLQVAPLYSIDDHSVQTAASRYSDPAPPTSLSLTRGARLPLMQVRPPVQPRTWRTSPLERSFRWPAHPKAIAVRPRTRWRKTPRQPLTIAAGKCRLGSHRPPNLAALAHQRPEASRGADSSSRQVSAEATSSKWNCRRHRRSNLF
jgi:hypothetical protein